MNVRYETSRSRSFRFVGLETLISTTNGSDVGSGGPISEAEDVEIVEVVNGTSVTDEDEMLGVLMTEVVLVEVGPSVEVMVGDVVDSSRPGPVVVDVLCREDEVVEELIPV